MARYIIAKGKIFARSKSLSVRDHFCRFGEKKTQRKEENDNTILWRSKLRKYIWYFLDMSWCIFLKQLASHGINL
jgi:hypothetical protein